MTEESQNAAPQTTEGMTTEERPVETAPVESPPVAETPNWLTELEKADPKELRKHPRIAGLIGGELQRAVQAERARMDTERQEAARREAEERLRKLAEEDPMEFARQWLTEEQQRGVMNQIETMRSQTRHELAESIGRAYRDVPEWAELTEADHQKLAEALAGKPDEEVIPTFNRAALDLVAQRKAHKLFEQWRDKELGKAREAIRQEEAARLLQGSDAPDTASPKGLPSRINVQGMSDEEFVKHYERTTGRKW